MFRLDKKTRDEILDGLIFFGIPIGKSVLWCLGGLAFLVLTFSFLKYIQHVLKYMLYGALGAIGVLMLISILSVPYVYFFRKDIWKNRH